MLFRFDNLFLPLSHFCCLLSNFLIIIIIIIIIIIVIVIVIITPLHSPSIFCRLNSFLRNVFVLNGFESLIKGGKVDNKVCTCCYFVVFVRAMNLPRRQDLLT